MNKPALLLLLIAQPAMACDWRVTESVDPMTDSKKCLIYSPTAKLGIGVANGSVTFAAPSAYHHDGLEVRVDDLPSILLDRDERTTAAYGSDARDLLALILTGQRIRTQYLSYPASVSGDAPICTLPALIESCR